jgi:hypothetical protein
VYVFPFPVVHVYDPQAVTGTCVCPPYSDRQVQCQCIVTSARIGRDIIIRTTRCISIAITCCPMYKNRKHSHLLTYENRLPIVRSRVTVSLASACTSRDIIVRATCCVSISVSCCPCIRIRRLLLVHVYVRPLRSSVQCQCIVTSARIGRDIIIRTTRCISIAITCYPCIRIAGIHSLLTYEHRYRLSGQELQYPGIHLHWS